MELWDLFDTDGNPSGTTMVRGHAVPSGMYHLVVHLWIKNKKGEYLIQKRSKNVASMPGFWAVTTGSSVSGEDTLTTAVREASEELGLSVSPDDLKFVGRLRRRYDFADAYLLTLDMEEKDFILQAEEVDEVRWVTDSELMSMVASGIFHNYGPDYFKRMLNS